MHFRILLSFVTIFYLCNCYAISISSPRSHSNIVAGSTIIITWSQTNITQFDIQLRMYLQNGNGAIVSRLATNVNPITDSHLVIIPNITSMLDHSIALTRKDVELASVGPLQIVSEPSIVPTTSTTISLSETASTMPTVSTPPLIAAAPIDTDHSDITSKNTSATEETESIGDDIGPTLSSGQVAIVSLCIGATASFLFCIYVLMKTVVRKRRSSSTFSIADDQYYDSDSQHSSQMDYYSSNNSSIRSIPSKKKMGVMENIHEEDTQYDSMYYGQHFTEGFVESSTSYSLSPSPKQKALPMDRISCDNHPFGQPPLHFNNNRYYADLPLPPPNSYGSQLHPENHDTRRTSSPTVPPLSPSKIFTS
ncbi:hypothetical protein BDF21DRAFT_424671 [Thamnidium elegans]|nr:hypothetical protein BDF21DRAFT_424671 [Thamnidium elegans]